MKVIYGLIGAIVIASAIGGIGFYTYNAQLQAECRELKVTLYQGLLAATKADEEKCNALKSDYELNICIAKLDQRLDEVTGKIESFLKERGCK
jgi:hypothetical protein